MYLFDWRPPARYPDRAGFKERTTSKDAAESMEPARAKLHADVLTELARGPATADEVALALGDLSVLAVRPRLSELRKLGKIAPTKDRRANVSGRMARVWRLVPCN